MEQVESSSRKPYVIMLIFGLTMLALSTWVAHEYRVYRHQVVNTTGTVTQIVTEELSSGHKRDRAVIAFTDEKGQAFRFRIPVAGTFFDYKEGESVPVVYDPAAPTNASVDGFWATWSLIMLCFVISYLTIVIMMRLYYYLRYRNAE